MTQSFILLGKLRRDVMILETNDDLDHLQQTGAEAVATGRAQEAFIIPCEAFYLASDHNWSGIDTPAAHIVGLDSSTQSPPLNPLSGEQPPPPILQQSNLPGETILGNKQAISDAGAKGPDTGSNPDLTPSAGALSTAGATLVQSDSPNPPTIAVGEPAPAPSDSSVPTTDESKPATSTGTAPGQDTSSSSTSSNSSSEALPPPPAAPDPATVEVPASEATEASIQPVTGAPSLDAEIAAAQGNDSQSAPSSSSNSTPTPTST